MYREDCPNGCGRSLFPESLVSQLGMTDSSVWCAPIVLGLLQSLLVKRIGRWDQIKSNVHRGDTVLLLLLQADNIERIYSMFYSTVEENLL